MLASITAITWNLKIEIKAFWEDENSDFISMSFRPVLGPIGGIYWKIKVLPQVNKEFSKGQKWLNMK